MKWIPASVAVLVLTVCFLPGCRKKSKKSSAAPPAKSVAVKPEVDKSRRLAGPDFPTLSATGAAKLPVVYPDHVMDYFEYREKLVEFWGLGIDKFIELKKGTDKEVAFLRQVFRKHGKLPSSQTWENLTEPADNAVIAKKDALLLTAASIVYSNQNMRSDATVASQLAINRFRSDHYPTRCLVEAHQVFNKNRMKSGLPNLDKPGAIYGYTDAIRHWLRKDFQATPQQHQFVYRALEEYLEQLKDISPNQLIAIADEIVNAPDIPGWIKEMFAGSAIFQYSWHLRGSGFSSTVGSSNWKKINQLTARATGHFNRAIEANGRFPEGIAAKLRLEQFENGENQFDEEQLFELGVDVQPDYFPLYEAQILMLQPRWGGSVEQMIEAGLTASRNNDAGLVGDLALCRAATSIMNSAAQYDAKALSKMVDHESCIDELLAALDRLAKEYAPRVDSQAYYNADYFKTVKLVFEHISNRWDVAKVTMEELGSDIDADGLLDTGYWLRPEAIESQIAALTGPSLEILREFDARSPDPFVWIQGKPLDLVKTKIGDAIEMSKSQAEKNYWIQTRTLLEWKFKFDAGEPVEILRDQNKELWQCSDYNQSRFEPDNAVLFDTTKGNSITRLESKWCFDGPKKLSFQLEFPDVSQNAKNLERDFWATVKFDSLTPPAGLQIGFLRNGRVSIFVPTKTFLESMPAWAGTTRQIEIYAANQFLEIVIDGLTVCRTRVRNLRIGPMVCIGTRNSTSTIGIGKFRVRNVVVQKWLAAEPPMSRNPDKLLKYFENTVRHEPDNARLIYQLGTAQFHTGDVQAATASFDKCEKLGYPLGQIEFYRGAIAETGGDTVAAKAAYLRSIESTDHPTAHYGRIGQSRLEPTHPLQRAGLRYAWLVSTAKQISGAELNQIDTIRSRGWMGGAYWETTMTQAAIAAAQGKFDQAARQVKKVLDVRNVPDSVKPTLIRQLEQYEIGKRFVADATDKPFYLTSPRQLYFPMYEDLLKKTNRFVHPIE